LDRPTRLSIGSGTALFDFDKDSRLDPPTIQRRLEEEVQAGAMEKK
jgi:hypothetical protein